MRIVEIDEKNYIGIFCDDEYYRIIEAVNGYLACHDDEFQNDYMSVGSSHEIVINNNIKVVIRRNSARSCYVGCWLYGEEVFAQTFGFNKGKEYAHGSENIEVSDHRINKARFKVLREDKDVFCEFIKRIDDTFQRTFWRDYLETIETPITFERKPTLIKELNLNKRIEEAIQRAKGENADIEVIQDPNSLFFYGLFTIWKIEIIYRLHDAGIELRDTGYNTLDKRSSYLSRKP